MKQNLDVVFQDQNESFGGFFNESPIQEREFGREGRDRYFLYTLYV